MKPIHIFRAGTHTSSNGSTLNFSEDALRQSAESYDPALMEAPIVVGHPKDNGPAFGWVQSIQHNEKGLHAVPHQVNPDFAELVEQGTYKKVSASFYSPEAPANPTPGKYYLRHVGFLGAMPPAIKGLDGVQFNEADEGVVEFSAEVDSDSPYIDGLLAKVADVFGLTPKADEAAMFAETETGEHGMTPEELNQKQQEIEEAKAALETAKAEFAERVEADNAAKEAVRKEAIQARVEALVAGSHILPADADAVRSFAEGIDAVQVLEFGEGEDAKKESAVDFFFRLMAEKKTGPEFSEVSGEQNDPEPAALTDDQIAKKAVEFRASEKAAGREISFTEAVNAVSK